MKTTITKTDKGQTNYKVEDCTIDELHNKLELFFESEGYKFSERNGDVFTFTKGNRALRLLFGAFVKYNKQSITVNNMVNYNMVTLSKESSGISGGLIGMNQVKKEFVRLSDALSNYLQG